RLLCAPLARGRHGRLCGLYLCAGAPGLRAGPDAGRKHRGEDPGSRVSGSLETCKAKQAGAGEKGAGIMRIWMEEQVREKDHFAAGITLSVIGLAVAAIALPCGVTLLTLILGGPVAE